MISNEICLSDTQTLAPHEVDEPIACSHTFFNTWSDRSRKNLQDAIN